MKNRKRGKFEIVRLFDCLIVCWYFFSKTVKQSNNLTICLFLILGFTSCFEPESGCLDVNATDFDVSADEPCPDDCCNYPELKLKINHVIIPPDNPDTTIAFRYNTFYPSNDGDLTDTFTIERIRYFVSNLKLVKTTGEKIKLLDSLQITVNGVSKNVEDNFTRADRDIFSTATLGTFIDNGMIDSILFTVGLEEEILMADTNSFPSGSSLSIMSDTLLFETDFGIIPNLVVFNKDTVSTTDSTILKIFDKVDIGLKLDQLHDIPPGFDQTVTLQVNYLEWFKGIDFPNGADPSNAGILPPIIVENITNSFSIISIE